MISPAAVRSSSPTTTRHGSRSASSTRAGDRVVVGDAQHVDARLDDRRRQLVGRRGGVARPHRVAVQVDPDPPGSDRRGEVRMTVDRPLGGNARPGGNGRHGRAAQAPDIVTSRMTRLTPAARIGSQSTSPPTSTMSCSIRCSVEAIVNSRTGSPSCAVADQQPGGAGREVAADRVHAGVQALHRSGRARRRRRRRSARPGCACRARAAAPGSRRRACPRSRRGRRCRSTPCRPAGPCSELCTNCRSTPPSMSTLRRAARPSPSTSVAV